MNLRWIFSFLALASILVGVSPGNAAGKLTINIASGPPITNAGQTGFLNQVVREVFRRLDLEAEVVVYKSSARSLVSADQGIDDGVGLRVKGLEKKYPNLLRVPEKIIVNDFVAFSSRHTITTDAWGALSNYDVAYINGWQIFQNNLTEHPAVLRVKSNRQLFELLSKGRTDFVLHERWQGTWHAQQMGIEARAQEPPLAKRAMFMYLHKKHADLVGPVASSLSAMKSDGTYRRIVETTLEALLPRK